MQIPRRRSPSLIDDFALADAFFAHDARPSISAKVVDLIALPLNLADAIVAFAADLL